MRRAIVIVYGSVAQSPRMLNHARSLVQAGWTVDLYGYGEDDGCSLAEGTGITLIDIPTIPNRSSRWFLVIINLFLRTFGLLWKVFWRTISNGDLTKVLCRRPVVDVVLVQNPPALPTLLVGPLVAWILGGQYWIDWHNLGYTLLSPNRFSLLESLEVRLGRLGRVHLAVSESMKKVWIEGRLGISSSSSKEHDQPQSIVLYDRPHRQFQHLELTQQHEVSTNILFISFPVVSRTSLLHHHPG